MKNPTAGDTLHDLHNTTYKVILTRLASLIVAVEVPLEHKQPRYWFVSSLIKRIFDGFSEIE